jgi:hypothetical protein
MHNRTLSIKKHLISPLALAIGLLIFGGLAASLYLVTQQQDVRQQAASCPHGEVNVEFRLFQRNTDKPWKSGSAMTNLKTGTAIDVNCFANWGSSLLPNGNFTVTRNNASYAIPASAKAGPTQIRNWKILEPGTYSFTCSSGNSCSNTDRIVVTGQSLITPSPTPSPSPSPSPTGPTIPPEDVACTADVKECPDGSFVARDPQNGCQFPACPETADTGDCPNQSFADLNKDCKVDTKDMQLFLTEFRKKYPSEQ